MTFSSRKVAGYTSMVASYLFFYLMIIAQIPLFSFPCRIGVCKTPVEITACQLITSKIYPKVVVKALLYPGALRKSFVKGTTVPSHDQLLKTFNSRMKKAPAITDLNHLEVLAGSYLCVAGAYLGLIRPGRMSFFGLCLIIWGFSRLILVQKHAIYQSKDLSMYSNMTFALLLAVFSLRRIVQKLIKCFRPKGVAKQLKSH